MDNLNLEKKYFLEINGKQEGPFSRQEVTDFLDNKSINCESRIWTEDMSNWAKIGEVADFFSIQQAQITMSPSGENKQLDFIKGKKLTPLSAIICGIVGLLFFYFFTSVYLEDKPKSIASLFLIDHSRDATAEISKITHGLGVFTNSELGSEKQKGIKDIVDGIEELDRKIDILKKNKNNKELIKIKKELTEVIASKCTGGAICESLMMSVSKIDNYLLTQ